MGAQQAIRVLRSAIERLGGHANGGGVHPWEDLPPQERNWHAEPDSASADALRLLANWGSDATTAVH